MMKPPVLAQARERLAERPVRPGQYELSRRADAAAWLGFTDMGVEPRVAAPPAGLVQDRMIEITLAGQGRAGARERGGARFGAAHVEHARLVDAVALRE